MKGGNEITLDSLLRQGYALSVSVEVQQKNLDGAVMGGIPRPTTGRLDRATNFQFPFTEVFLLMFLLVKPAPLTEHALMCD